MEKHQVAVLGGGPFGIVVANLLARKFSQVHLWHPTSKDAESLQASRVAHAGQFSFRLDENIDAISGYRQFGQGSWAFFIAVPSQRFEDTLESLLQYIDTSAEHFVIIMTRGLLSRGKRRRHNIYTFSQYVDYLAQQSNCHRLIRATVSGPSLLEEMQLYHYSFFQAGCGDEAIRDFLLRSLKNEYINLDFTNDISGVEVVSVLKDSIAVASGIIAELPHCGHNLQGMLVSRGFQEMLRFGLRLGAKRSTLLGTAGLADLFSTISSPNNRDRRYGQELTRKILGKESRINLMERIQIFFKPATFIEKEAARSQEVVEGALALAPVLEIATEKGLELPLFKTLYSILVREKGPEELVGLFADIAKLHRPGSSPKPASVQMIAGQAFNDLLQKRILRYVSSKPGVQERIKNQAANTIRRLRRRMQSSRPKRHTRKHTGGQATAPRELSLWHGIQDSPPEKIQSYLEDIIALYVQGISDQYRPTMRATLIRIALPSRFLIGGMRPGASIPAIGGEIEQVRKIARSHSILYVPTHRSHLDSIEVGLGVHSCRLPVPRYAAGSNLMQGRLWSWALKSLGAYSVDRELSQNFLYLECLGHYSQMLLEAGIPSLIYPEGTRSRSGAICPIKTGLLSTAMNAYRSSGNDIAIVPLALSYENVPEDLEFNRISKRTSLKDFIRRRTYAYLNICKPIFISDYLNESDPILAVSQKIHSAWRYNLTILPNHILAHILTRHASEIEMAELEDKVENFILSFTGNYLTQNPEKIISSGLRTLQRRDFIKVKGGKVFPLQKACLSYYGNMIPDNPKEATDPAG